LAPEITTPLPENRVMIRPATMQLGELIVRPSIPGPASDPSSRSVRTAWSMCSCAGSCALPEAPGWLRPSIIRGLVIVGSAVRGEIVWTPPPGIANPM